MGRTPAQPDPDRVQPDRFGRNPKEILSRIWELQDLGVVVEVTGTYGLELALALHAAMRVDLHYINPVVAKALSQTRLRRSKTDSVDAAMLARLAKLAKHLGTDQVNAVSMAHTNDQPDPRRPIVYTITGDNIEARCLLMPARRR